MLYNLNYKLAFVKKRFANVCSNPFNHGRHLHGKSVCVCGEGDNWVIQIFGGGGHQIFCPPPPPMQKVGGR